jgi:Protein of unknown function (DUF2442).
MGVSIKVKDVKPLDDMKLFVLFENDVTKIYDVKQLIPEYPIYTELENKSLFDLVHVDCGGYAIAWNEDIDIPEVELWEGGIEQNG